MKTAIIAGHTGLVGEQLLSLLLEEASYTKVIAVGRRKIELSHPKLEQQLVDFNDLNIKSDKVDDVFCCLGTTMKVAGSKEKFRLVDFQYPLNLGQYCQKKGARSYSLVSSMGADSTSSIFYNKVKGEVEETIDQLGYSQLNIYRPSMLLGQRKEFRLGEAIGKTVMVALGFFFVGSLKNYKAIESIRVARAMLHFAKIAGMGKNVHPSAELQLYR